MMSDEAEAAVDAEAPAQEQAQTAQDAEGGGQGEVAVSPVAFSPLSEDSSDEAATDEAPPLDLILDLEVPVVVELGRTEMTVEELLALKPGSILELDRMAGEPVDLVIRDHVVAQGEIVVVDESFGLRVTAVVEPGERTKDLH
ncbi:MAG: flagellar motor switch protein FliN [Candidatus Brocadiia bacterium]